MEKVKLKSGCYIVELYVTEPEQKSDGKHITTKGGIIINEAVAKDVEQLFYKSHPVVAKVIHSADDCTFKADDVVLLRQSLVQRMLKDVHAVDTIIIDNKMYYVLTEGLVAVAMVDFDLSDYKQILK